MKDHMTSELDVLEHSLALRARGQAFALATVVRCAAPTSAKPGAKAVILPCGQITGWIGGGCAQPTIQRVARRAIEEGKAYLVRIAPDGQPLEDAHYLEFAMTCSSQGSLDIFVEPVLPKPWLLVLGHSPVARAIPPLAARVGFRVALAFPGLGDGPPPGLGDSSPPGLGDSSPPGLVADADADCIIDGWALPPEIGRPDFVVVASQGERDEEALAAALALGPRHLALVASAKKAAKLKAALLSSGHDASALAAIHAPAGVEIGAISAEEIALSVVAELVRTRRTEPASAPRSVASEVSVELSAAPPDTGSAIDPVCGMSVGTRTTPHKTQWREAQFFFCCEGCLRAFQSDPEKYLMATS